LHAARKRLVVRGLGEEVDVVGLDGDVDDPESLAQCRGDRRIAQGLVQLATSQVADSRVDTQDHVQGVAGLDRRSLLVRRAGTGALRLASGTLALAAVAEELLLDMPLAAPLRHPLHAIVIATLRGSVNGECIEISELMLNDCDM